MKPRSTTSSNSRARGGVATRRSRSTLPAVTRRPKPAGPAKRQKKTSIPARSAAKANTASRGSRSRMNARKTEGRGADRQTSTRKSTSSVTTTDHEEIRRWVESHGGIPATVKSTSRGNDPAGLLRIDFPGYSGGQSLKAISWSQFFKVFDQRKLAFLYQGGSKGSRFNKLICRTA